jgi:hypothetical protein
MKLQHLLGQMERDVRYSHDHRELGEQRGAMLVSCLEGTGLVCLQHPVRLE